VKAFITVRSLKSVEKDGRPHSDRIDEIMYESLREQQNRMISYRLAEMTLKGATNRNEVPQYEFDSRGELVVAGVTNEITMPVFVHPLGGGKLKICNYPGLNEATWALAAGFASKVLSLCTGLSEIY
jgi:hypothetical protein